MKILEAMKTRYSVKKYNNDSIDDSIIQELKEILQLSPSSINAQPWRFIFVRNVEMKAKFAESSKFNEEKIKQADTLVIFQIKTEQFFNNDAPSYIPEKTFAYYQQEVTKRPGGYYAWSSRQSYIAMGILLAACAEMGIGSTPMEGIIPKEYDEIIQDSNFKSIAAVSLGFPAVDDYNHPSVSPKQRLALDKIIMDM